MALTLKTPPASEPVTTDELRTQANILTTDDNAQLDLYEIAARQFVEAFTKRQLVTATWELRLDAFPALEIVVPRPPLSAVNSIVYIDTNGDEQTWTAALYQTDLESEPGRIKPAFGESWPSVRLGDYNVVTVDFDAGYGDLDTVPERFKQAIKVLVTHWYEIRMPVERISKEEVPFSVKALLMQDRAWVFS